MEILLLTDYRGNFYSSTKYRGAGFDINKLRTEFLKLGYKLIVVGFQEIDFKNQNYKGKYILYQSSEDPGLYYKDYIEDILLGLQEQGAILIPQFKYFRAHHNKVFLEVLRDISRNQIFKTISSKSFGTYEDYIKYSTSYSDKEAKVLKASNTSKSRGVFLITKKSSNIVKQASRTFSLQNLRYIIRTIITGKKHLKISNFRKKFIVQDFIPGLAGDFRIIIYGDKYYSLYRENRKRDFRASGSMRFFQEVKPSDELLNFAKKVFEYLDVPYLALDIAVKNGIFYLFEFQVVSFGQYTLEKSKGFYFLDNNKWVFKEELPFLEKEFAVSVVKYLQK